MHSGSCLLLVRASSSSEPSEVYTGGGRLFTGATLTQWRQDWGKPWVSTTVQKSFSQVTTTQDTVRHTPPCDSVNRTGPERPKAPGGASSRTEASQPSGHLNTGQPGGSKKSGNRVGYLWKDPHESQIRIETRMTADGRGRGVR